MSETPFADPNQSSGSDSSRARDTASSTPSTPEEVAAAAERDRQGKRDYWRANLRLMTVLLIFWFVVSYGLGILLVEPLNQVRLGGFPLGFWFAHQGSIYVFVVLIFVYARAMDRIDRRFGVE